MRDAVRQTLFICVNLCALLSNGQVCKFDHDLQMATDRPLVIAHRGYSGALPEHTAEAYKLAISEGADFIECDATLTKDLVAICLHESWINATTNVASVFPDRISTYWVADQKMNITDYFSIDFSIDEIKQIGKVQQLAFRDQRYNGQFQIVTLQEHIDLAKSNNEIGIYVEIKDPIFMNTFINESGHSHNQTFEDLILAILNKNGFTESKSNCLIQSFSSESLVYISKLSKLKLVQLLDYSPDFNTTQLDRISTYAYAVGPDKNSIVTVEDRQIARRTDFVDECHKRGLKVHPYTFRNEDRYLAWDFYQDYSAEHSAFFDASVDGLFTDFPGSYRNFLNGAYAYATTCASSAAPVAVELLSSYLVYATVGACYKLL